jgi:hypothetical protein
MMRLKAYRWRDIDIGSYRRPQEVQMTSTMVECLQGIQKAMEAALQYKNGSGNTAIKYEHFTRADDTYMKCDMCPNTLWMRYY